VDVIWLDEEPPYDIYRECTMRTVGTRKADGTISPGGIMLMTFTPLDGMTKVCRLFLNPGDEESEKNGYVVASWEDNPYLPPDEMSELRRETPEHEREAREHGRPVLGSGMVYPVAESHYAVEPFEIPDHYKRGIGLDHGWVHPAAISWWAMDPNTGICYLYQTWRANKTAIPIIASLLRGTRYIPIFADPSGEAERQEGGGSTLHDQYAQLGIYCQPADNQVEAGIMDVLEGLMSGKIKVFTTCQQWWEEIRVYQRNDAGKVLKDYDDTMDSARYGYRHRHSFVSYRDHMTNNLMKKRKSKSWKVR